MNDEVKRSNPLLDELINGTTAKRSRRNPVGRLEKDIARRRAFRVLAQIDDLNQKHRAMVLKTALRLSGG